MADVGRAERILSLYVSLHEGCRINIPQIVDEYTITRRSASRDLNVLQSLLPDLEEEVLASTGVKNWRLPKQSRRVHVSYNIQDIMALFMGRRLFDFLEGTSLEERLGRVYKRIETQLERAKDLDDAAKISRKVYLVHEGPKKLGDRERDILDECLTGLIYEWKVRVVYRNAKGRERHYTIHPYTLTAYKRGLYLVAFAEQKHKPIVLSLERIIEAEFIRNERFDYPEAYSPEQFFEGAMFITLGEPEPVELRFTPTTKRFIEIRQFHSSQALSTLPDGRVRMQLHVPVSFELVNWVLSFGAHVEVIAPERLRTEVADSLRSALSQYSHK